jgi:hypothetical protein
MVQIEIEINELRDAEMAARVEDEIHEAAERVQDAREPEHRRVGFSVLDEGRFVDIQIDVPGWTGRRTLDSQPLPGEARRAAEELLETVGLL